jgi:FdhD protein
MAGISMLAAVSAPSSLAAELATDAGMTLVGFLRGDSMVIYAGAERITGGGGRAAVDVAGAEGSGNSRSSGSSGNSGGTAPSALAGSAALK